MSASWMSHSPRGFPGQCLVVLCDGKVGPAIAKDMPGQAISTLLFR